MATRTNIYRDARKETWDGAAGTYTAWDPDGKQTEARALTSAEVAALAAIDNATTTAAKLAAGITAMAAARAKVDAIAAKPVPALTDITALAQAVSQVDQVLIQVALRAADQMRTT